MNKQINELWWKARIGYNNQSCDNEVIEKFANLIVQECTRKIINSYKGKINPAPAVEAIEQHFGVMFKRM